MEQSDGGLIRQNPVPPTGLTVLVMPKEPSIDVVFVHGFTGHPERTWTHQKGDLEHRNDSDADIAEPSSKRQKLGPFLKSRHTEPRPSIYWPVDLLPTALPNARVLTYGYDTHIRHKLVAPVSQSTVYDIAWNFLIALEAERRMSPKRQILFVVHSLGGIVVKEMLRRSSSCQHGQAHLRTLFDATAGVVFFGTPHGGADPRSFVHRVAEKIIKAAGFSVNDQIVQTLLPSAERLRELRDEFGPMAQRQSWIIHSFQEQLGVSALGGLKVVEDTSSYLNLPSVEICEQIGRNHMDMCRFTGPNDIEYKKVVAALLRMTVETSHYPEETQDGQPLCTDLIAELLGSLKFDQIDARQLTIKNAHAKTCKWLLKTNEYVDWINPREVQNHHGFLWIKGKPGTGKSTLMKFALANARRTLKKSTIISFFFNARGEELEKCTLGTYRSLLVQLLERHPSLQSVFNVLEPVISNTSSIRQWNVETLKLLLEQTIRRLGGTSIVCFIDALDECDENQVRDMVSFFEKVCEECVSSQIDFRVCLSSRHYPHVSIRKSINLTLEGHEGHSQDISDYLTSELKIGHSNLAEKIREEVQEKASGIFMWVVLVVGMLNKEHDSGRMHALRRRIREIPGDLHQLFLDLLTRDALNKGELILCLQWVLFARNPLRPEQLHFAILSGTAPEDVEPWDTDEITTQDIERFILNASKGLAEITKSKNPTVQFIHESVRDFLLKEEGLGKIWQDLKNNFQGLSHSRLRDCCMNHVGMDIFRLFGIPESHGVAHIQRGNSRKIVTDGLPFWDYAVQNVLYHADAAAKHSSSQEDFLRAFPLDRWRRYSNIVETKRVREHDDDVGLLYFLAEYNLPNLIHTYDPAIESMFEVQGRYGPPLFAALATGSKDALQALLEIAITKLAPESEVRKLLAHYHRTEKSERTFRRSFEYRRNRQLYSYLIEAADTTMLTLMHECGLIRDILEGWHELFKLAIEQEDESSLQYCLNSQPEIISQYIFQNGYSLFPAILDHFDMEILKRLLEICVIRWNGTFTSTWQIAMMLSQTNATVSELQGVFEFLSTTNKFNLNIKDEFGLSFLTHLIRANDDRLARALLQTGNVIVDSQDNDGRTTLSHAIYRPNGESVVRMLLELGKVDVNLQDNCGRSPLSYAVCKEWGYDIVRLLLSMDTIDVNLKDNNGRTPLSYTVCVTYGHDIVRMLLSKDTIDVNSTDNEGRTPLCYAVCNVMGSYMIRLLLSKDTIEVNSKDNEGRTPLSYAVCKSMGHDIVRLLLSKDTIDVNSQDDEGRTPLSYAVSNIGIVDKSIIGLLLSVDTIDVNSKDNDGRTPLSYLASTYGYSSHMELLLEKGAEVDARDNKGRTPLSYAASNWDGEAYIKLLVGRGARIEAGDNMGRTPLSYAADCWKENVQVLMKTRCVDVEFHR
ncbi:ankyrin [Corynespora cassiicola Philippines]|uniref:Ankyrin n=1 Tax=Corynespora cassiicola Philippines TaxID=1448308 RepID=A0A2T2P6H3_CORCC|nr:ankyrin [Corynespora cassiicola Philippines]